jgi:hypothetical protein
VGWDQLQRTGPKVDRRVTENWSRDHVKLCSHTHKNTNENDEITKSGKFLFIIVHNLSSERRKQLPKVWRNTELSYGVETRTQRVVT